MAGCGRSVLPPLAQEALCLDHYLELAFGRLRAALELCQRARPFDSRTLEWLLADADFAVHSLAQETQALTPLQRTRLLELLLGLANLQEYLRHHSVDVKLSE